MSTTAAATTTKATTTLDICYINAKAQHIQTQPQRCRHLCRAADAVAADAAGADAADAAGADISVGASVGENSRHLRYLISLDPASEVQ